MESSDMRDSYPISDFARQRPIERLAGDVSFPKLGDIVHFVGHKTLGGETDHRAAIVTLAHGTLVIDLEVFDTIGAMNYKVGSVTWDPTGTRENSWHWPER
jgi:hypothetical protein